VVYRYLGKEPGKASPGTLQEWGDAGELFLLGPGKDLLNEDAMCG